MKRLLVPIDYSYDAITGLEYAASLAKVFNAEITLFNVLPVSATLLQNLKGKQQESSKDLAKKSLNQMALDILENSPGSLKYQIRLAKGEAVEEIIREAESGDYTMIVMGTRDKHNLLDKWLGTVSIGVSQTCTVPVLLVPHGCRYESYEKMLIASDSYVKDNRILQFLAEWNHPFQAYCKFLHVKSDADDSFEEESTQILRNYYNKKEVHFPFEIELKDGLDVPATIYRTAIQENMDLIVLTAGNRSALQSLLLKSVSYEVIIRSVKPVLVLHSPSMA